MDRPTGTRPGHRRCSRRSSTTTPTRSARISAPHQASPGASRETNQVTTYETLLWDVDADGIATLTLHRPDALNAFNLTMARELEQVFLTDALDDAVRAVVVT